jgi:hypothetical protein
MSGKLFGTKVTFANGQQRWAMIGNLDDTKPELTKHFATLSIRLERTWFHLARYHDFDHDERDPTVLAKLLGMSVDDIFPITYDIRELAIGDPAVPRGVFIKEGLPVIEWVISGSRRRFESGFHGVCASS